MHRRQGSGANGRPPALSILAEKSETWSTLAVGGTAPVHSARMKLYRSVLGMQSHGQRAIKVTDNYIPDPRTHWA
eukprot:3999041-Pyramimonas_sp.AAC.1